MSKRSHKKDCCCCYPIQCCYEPCCCPEQYCCNQLQNVSGNNLLGSNGGCWEAIIFWLIACGAGLLNNNSILIILLFLLYGWSQDSCQTC